MDDRVASIARGALQRLGNEPAPALSGPDPSTISSLTLEQFANLAMLRLEDPLVRRVVEDLRLGRPVTLDRGSVERDLGLGGYPPPLREQFQRWFGRLSALGILLVGAEPPSPERPAPDAACEPEAGAPEPARPAPQPVSSPDRQVLREILGDECDGDSCLISPGSDCQDCGRCKTLGF